ncbi:outer membrane beta-barrel protein [uncultured Microbulbifer sp.]|uniref:outer membrane beta-barrel protein n=1 Tax=uncultured Microbulbifer sp. TaxID=348147 RepID=UPI00260A525E|nr:outer membrane beta-barrel protein [uncultured Microbulbifer sp.]
MNRLILAAAILFFASNTMATESNFYLKSSYGKVDPDGKLDTDFPSLEDQENLSVKLSNPKGWSLALGYRLDNFIALEAGYADLGDADSSVSEVRSNNFDYGYYSDTYERENRLETTLSRKSKMLGIFLTTDVTKDFYAGIRTGFHSWDADLKYKFTSNTKYTETDNSGSVTYTDTYNYEESDKERIHDSDLYYGISAGWNFNENWSLSLEHTIFEMNEDKPSLSSLALTYNF